MGQPATAAIVVACIFIGLFSVYAAYRIYVKWYWRRHGGASSAPLPPIREPPSAYAVATPGSPPVTGTVGTLYGDTWRNSWRGSASKASLAASSHFDTLPYSNGPRRLSANALLVHGDYSSAPASPLSTGADSPLALPTPPTEAYDHTRGISSNSSTNALKRNYASSVTGGLGPSSADAAVSPIKRSSYLPHLPSNRESINIVPPQPLGFGGFSSMATATDQRTLAFSKVSGIGSGDDDFSAGLVWDGSSGGVNEFGAAGGSGNAASLARLREEERLRYLAQGPGRSTRASSVTGGMPASNSQLLYAPNGEGWRTPEMPSSRSLSPSQAAWEASSDNSSPRAGKPLPAHPLESAQDVSRRSSSAIDGAASGARLANAFTSLQSPLQLMSSPQPSEGQHGRHYSDADTLMTAGTHQSNGEPSGGALGTTHDTGSPILGAFRSVGAAVSPRSVATPDLTSRSASGTGSGSHSSPTTGPPTESSLSASGRPSAASGIDDEAAAGRAFAVGKDGQLALTGTHDLEAVSDTEKGAPRRSWGLSSLIGGKA